MTIASCYGCIKEHTHGNKLITIRSFDPLPEIVTKALFSHNEYLANQKTAYASACLKERSPDLTFKWGSVRSFSSDLRERIKGSNFN